MSRSVGLRALFAALVIVSVALGVATPLPTSSVWRDNVWATAKITTATRAVTTYPGGFTPGQGTTLAADPVWTNESMWNTCMRIEVTSESSTPVVWSVQLDTSAQPWNGVTEFRVDYGYVLSPLVGGRHRTITGDSTLNPPRHTVAKGTVRTISICAAAQVTPPIGDSSWYTVTVSKPFKESEARVCRTVTATALGKTPFWFRWRATVPTADMFTLLGTQWSYSWWFSTEAVVRDPEPSRDPSAPSTVVLTPVLYTTDTMLRGSEQFSYKLCLYS